MTNKHGIPINRRERIFDEAFEYILPYGTISKYKLDRRLYGIN